MAAELCAAAARLGARPEARRGSRPPIASLDRFHPIGRSTTTRLEVPVENGEGFRAGRGWLASEAWGCRVAEGGGRLAFALSLEAVTSSLTLAVRLVAPHRIGCSVTIGTVTGNLAPDERRAFLCPIEPDASGSVSVCITSSPLPGSALSSCGDRVGIEGFKIRHGEAD
ncbi:hypothetical protein [Sphingomonas bacterium]|uniref:hypothetical protein n=1 Tax=Sphingomonas bacterium TaxID=1895847 RepID=UPI001575FFBF|nr:hypothetical protein [Sphingomonas bacterium]